MVTSLATLTGWNIVADPQRRARGNEHFAGDKLYQINIGVEHFAFTCQLDRGFRLYGPGAR